MEVANTKIAWIGTGVMGAAMCRRLMEAGASASVYNRTRSKAQPLVDAGARLCETPADAVREAEVVFTIVGYPTDVEEVYLGDDGIIANAAQRAVLVDMTTSRPSLAVHIAEAAGNRGLLTLDAPVSGGDVGARDGRLAIMAGGDQRAFDSVVPLLKVLWPSPRLMGGPGSGQHTKMANQILIASTMMGVCESLLYSQKAGLDPSAVIEVIGSGAAGSWSINNLGPRIVGDNWDPGFYIRHFIKDLGIALDEAARLRLSLPGLALADQLYKAAASLSLEDLGTQGLYKVYAALHGVSSESRGR